MYEPPHPVPPIAGPGDQVLPLDGNERVWARYWYKTLLSDCDQLVYPIGDSGRLLYISRRPLEPPPTNRRTWFLVGLLVGIPVAMYLPGLVFSALHKLATLFIWGH